MPGTLKKYQALQRKKKSFCAGRTTKAEVKRVAKIYVDAAVKGGQTKTEAERKATRVLKAGCSITANIAGKKKAATTRKRKTTTTAKPRRRTAATATRRRARA